MRLLSETSASIGAGAGAAHIWCEAAARRDLALLGKWIERGRDALGNTLKADALVLAAAEGWVDGALRLAERLGVDARDARGATALIAAAGRGREACVRALIEAGADPSLVDHHGLGALESAILAKNRACVRLLAPVTPATLRGGDGSPMLHRAVHSGDLDILEMVLPHAEPSARDADGGSALHRAALAGEAPMIEALSRSLSPLDLDARGRTPFCRLIEPLERASAGRRAAKARPMAPAGAPVWTRCAEALSDGASLDALRRAIRLGVALGPRATARREALEIDEIAHPGARDAAALAPKPARRL
jgi:hypothetical protein